MKNSEGNRLAGKVVVVTGGTKGIGRGIALAAVKEGAKVVISGRDEEAGQAVTRAAATYSQNALRFLRADMGKVDDCRRLIDYAVESFGRIDGLVNNAAIFPQATLAETSEEMFDSIFNINVKGAFYCTAQAVEFMKNHGGGSIVNIGSMTAFVSNISQPAYGCSKGALHSLTRHVAGNYGDKGIRANWVTVGWVASDGELARMDQAGEGIDELDALARKYIPSGRLQTAEDNAAAVIFLLSDESSQMTGTDLQITGGKYF